VADAMMSKYDLEDYDDELDEEIEDLLKLKRKVKSKRG
jgi:hypothetical protein